ncbi:MAG: sulfatase-like hydrolase/transferase [Planctomycetota bacterium]|jgi:arylsulfatase A-like enzyme
MFKKLTLWIICGALASCSLVAQAKPNIVMFYVDDWAWNGSPVAMDDSMENSRMPVLQMPNIEKLTNEGMKFRNAYGSPQCSPARACIQTGQSNPRSGLTVYLNSPEPYYDTQEEYHGFPLVPNVSDRELDEDAVTIAEALKPLGYVSAHVGKWHMRGDPGKEGYVLHDGATDNNPGNTLKVGLKEGEPTPRRLPKDMSDPKLMFSTTEKAISFIEEQVEKGNPFYVQISHYAMHAGRECLDKTREKYLKHPRVQAWYKENRKDPETINRKDDPAIWLGMGEDLDGRIGTVIDKTKELGIEDNTYFIVVADNGYRHEELQLKPGLKQPLHARKWWLWDGGIRVPMIVKGPGIKPGSEFTGNVVNYDFLPTFVDWAGGDSKKLQNIDGVSLADYMAGKKPDEAFLNRNLYFHYPHYRSSIPHSVMISGSSKVIHFYHRPDIPMLFDLSGDIGEVTNIVKQNPETHKKLHDEMMRYLKEVRARFPKVNPDYDPEVYKMDRKTKERLQWGPFEGQRTLDDDEI